MASENGGRPAFKPTEAKRGEVRLLVAGGISERVIADRIGIARDTLKKHFAHELEFGREDAIAENLERIRKAASKGNVSAMKYLDGRLNSSAGSPAPAGKKLEQQRAAETAGSGTDWADDLRASTPVN